MLTETINSLYSYLLHSRPKRWETMLVIADVLEEQGRTELAAAYRWASERKKWPFSRRNRGAEIDRKRRRVWDWDREGRATKVTPPECRLPAKLFDHMCRLRNRKYGGVDQAFVLLANVLAGRTEYAEL